MGKFASIGDSQVRTQPYGATTVAQTFTGIIGSALGYAPTNIINAGVNSDTTAGVLARLQSDVIAQHPDMCIVMVGLNDWIQGVSIANVTNNLSQIFAQLIADKIQPIYFTSNIWRDTPAQLLAYQPYLRAVKNVCADYNVTCVDIYNEVAALYLYDSATYTAIYADNVHFTVAGHQWAADFAMRHYNAKAFKSITPDPLQLNLAVADYLTSANGVTLADISALRAQFP